MDGATADLMVRVYSLWFVGYLAYVIGNNRGKIGKS